MALADYGYMESRVVSAATLATTGDKGTYGAGFRPMILRAVAVVYRAAATGVGMFQIAFRPTAGSDAGRTVAATGGLLVAPAGSVMLKTGLDLKLMPGNELVIAVSTVATGLTSADVYAYFDVFTERPGNVTNVTVV